MYYPFLRGKLYELLSLRELSDDNNFDNIVPIIEPVQSNISALNKATEKLEENDNEYIFIYKTNVGDLDSPDDYYNLVDHIFRRGNQIPGFILDGKNDNIVIEIIRRLDCTNIALIHYERISNIDEYVDLVGLEHITNILHIDRLGPFIRRNYRNFNNILLRDPFTSERRNADYEDVGEQLLSDDHIYCEQEGYNGYSDYLTIGEEYSNSGFAPYAVAIHLTYLKSDYSCWVKHFVSDSNFDQTDIAGKYMEALEKLVEWVDMNPDLVTRTSALQEFLDLFDRGHFPGLGYLKKLSIKHHIEMINDYFNNHHQDEML